MQILILLLTALVAIPTFSQDDLDQQQVEERLRALEEIGRAHV